MKRQQLEALRDKARHLCREHRIAVLPYGEAWWILGRGVSFVAGEIAGLTPSQLAPLEVMERPKSE